MSSTDSMELEKEEPKLVRCDNCRQDIEEKIMFLHEGFCFRNNIFCEHCKNVFLKKDYEQHIKELPNNLTQEKEDSANNSKKSTSNEEEIPLDTEFQEITTVNPNPSLEVIHLPLEEQFTINTPIIISEGQIISNQNKNEYLLPFLGINPIKNYNVLNENYFYNESYDDEKQNVYNILMGEEMSQNYGFNNYFESNYQYNFSNSNEIYEQNLYWNNFNNSYEGNMEKNNDFYINNNIISYDDKENNYKSNNYLSEEIYPQSYIKANDNYSQDINQNLLLENKFEKTPENGKRKKNAANNTSKSKEPIDSISKFKSSSHIINKKKNNKKKIKSHKSANTLEKKRMCKYCNIDVEDLSLHYKKCKSRGINSKKEMKNPKKSDNTLLNKTLNDNNIEEHGIEDSKKQILNRDFIYSFQESTILDSGEISPNSLIWKTEKKLKKEKKRKGKGISLIKKKLFVSCCPIITTRKGLSLSKEKQNIFSGNKNIKNKNDKKGKFNIEKEKAKKHFSYSSKNCANVSANY